MRKNTGNFRLSEYVYWTAIISVVLAIAAIYLSIAHISMQNAVSLNEQLKYAKHNSDRNNLRHHALSILSLIKTGQEREDIESKHRLRREARKLNILVNSIYKKNRHKSHSALKKHLASIINDLSNEMSDYYFIYDFQKKDFIVPESKVPEIPNKQYQAEMKALHETFVQAIYSQNETLLEYNMIRTSGDEQHTRSTTAYVFYFKPLDILLGANLFPYEMMRKLKKEFLENLDVFEDNTHMQIFTGNYNGEIFIESDDRKRNIILKDKEGKIYSRELVRAALKGGDYIEYESSETQTVVNYVIGIDEWEMYFCCQIIMLNDSNENGVSFLEVMSRHTGTLLVLFSVLIVITIIVGSFFKRKISSDIRNIEKWVDGIENDSSDDAPEFHFYDLERLLTGFDNNFKQERERFRDVQRDNEFLKSVIDQAHIGIQIWVRNKRNSIRIKYTNRYYSNLMDLLTKSKFSSRRTGILRSTVHKCLISVRNVFDPPHNRLENEVTIEDVDGKNLYLNITATPVFNKKLEFVACTEIVTDVSEKSRDIDRLKTSEQNYKEIFNTSTDAITIFEPDEFRVVDVNKAMLKLFGYTYEEALRLSYLDLSHEHSKIKIIQYKNLFASIKEKSPLYFIWKGKKNNGRSISLENVLKRVNIGKKEHVLLFSKDITIQKEAQDELERTKSYLDNIVNSMPSALIGADMDGKIIEANNKALELGIDQNVIGRHILVTFPWLEDYLDLVFSSIKEKTPKSKSKQVIHIHNKKMYFNITCYPLPSEFENQAVIQLDNVTDQVRIEEMIIQSEKMMTVGGLAAGMAHEINNPLGIIMQAAENTLRRLSPDFDKNRDIAERYHIDLQSLRDYMKERQVLDFIKSIQDASGRASEIVKNMLNFSRMKTERKENLDINSIVNDTIYLAMHDYDLKKQYDFKSINLVKDLGDALPNVNVSKTEIEQVILNLLKNAAHAMINKKYDDKPEIRIRTIREENYLKISIIDNGKGMSENMQKRIFEPFYTTKPVGSGTGLGLSVSYFIVTNNHNGKLEVESKPGNGARFTISLPI